MPAHPMTVLYVEAAGSVGALERLTEPLARHFEGAVLAVSPKTCLCRFPTATDAAVAALALQEVLRRESSGLSGGEPGSAGLMVDVAANDAADLTQRLAGLPVPGEVMLSEPAFRLLNQAEIPAVPAGPRRGSNGSQAVRLYRVPQEHSAPWLRRITSSVGLRDGLPVFTKLPTQDRKAKRWLAAAGLLALLVALILIGGAAWLQKRERERAPAEQAQALLNQGKAGQAFELARLALETQPGDAGLEALAVLAAGRYLDELTRTHGKSEAALWLAAALERHAWLAPLQGRNAALDCEVRVARLVEVRASRPEVEAEVQALLKKYPQPEAPYAMAGQVRRGFPVDFYLELYAEALRRGIKLTNLDSFEACVVALETYPAGHPLSGTALSLMKEHFPKERAAWAEKTLDKGAGHAWLHAYGLVTELGLPKVKDPFYESIARVLGGQDPAAGGRVLLRLKRDEQQRAAAILARSLEAQAVPAAVREQVSQIVRELQP